VEWLAENPGARVRAPKEPRGRLRYLSSAEKSRLLDACRPDPQLYALVVTALSTGARQGELQAITLSRVGSSPGARGSTRSRKSLNGPEALFSKCAGINP
jgi:site-specific recombinase XerC